MTWTNKDGLIVRFNDENAVEPKVRVETGTLQRMVVKLEDATLLQTNATNPLTTSIATFWDETAPFIPAGSYITRAYFKVDTAFTSGGSAVLDIGLIQATGAHVDIDAIDDGIAVAALGANAVVNCNGAGVGGVVQTSTTLNTYVSFSYETAAFTAGAGTLVVEYYKFD